MRGLYLGVIVVFVFLACGDSQKQEQVPHIQPTATLSLELSAKLDLQEKESRVFVMQDMHERDKIAILEIAQISAYNNDVEQSEYKITLFSPRHTSALPIGFTIPVEEKDGDLLFTKLSDNKVRLGLDSNGILELEYLDKGRHKFFSQHNFFTEVDFMSAEMQYFIARRKCSSGRECLKFVPSCDEFEECYSNRALVTLPFIPLTHSENANFIIRNINKQMYQFLEHSTARQDLFYAQDLSAQRQEIRDYLHERLSVRRMAQKIIAFKMPHSDFLGTSKVGYMDSTILEFVMNMYFYEGSEQYIYTYPMIFSLKNGAQLPSERIENLFYAGVRDWEDEVFASVEFKALLEKYRNKESTQCLPKDEDEILPPDNFFIKHSGVGFTYNTKGLVSKGCGIIEVLVPFSELKPFVDSSSPYAHLFGI